MQQVQEPHELEQQPLDQPVEGAERGRLVRHGAEHLGDGVRDCRIVWDLNK